MGTPDYVAPEQIKGKSSDARSDLYSVGIMLFEMLAGEVPFCGLDPRTAMSLRISADPPLLGEINPDISPRLQGIVDCAIARDRSSRYTSAREFACELFDVLGEEMAERPLESLAGPGGLSIGRLK